MLSARTDQAEGLRRMITRSGLRIVSMNAAADGGNSTAAIVNLAGALAERGADVLILDALSGERSVAAALGLKVRHDLEDVIRRRRNLEDVIVHGPAGILILPLARGARSLAQLAAAEQQRLIEHCAQLALPMDTLLMDASAGGAGALLGLGTAAQEVIVVSGASAGAITAAYAQLKRLVQQYARREFHLLVSNIASEAEARALYKNMAGVARRYLQVSLRFMGHIPQDDKLQHAARLRLPVVAAFPAAAAAGSFRGLAHAVTGWPRAEEVGNGFDDFMRRLIHFNSAQPAAA